MHKLFGNSHPKFLQSSITFCLNHSSKRGLFLAPFVVIIPEALWYRTMAHNYFFVRELGTCLGGKRVKDSRGRRFLGRGSGRARVTGGTRYMEKRRDLDTSGPVTTLWERRLCPESVFAEHDLRSKVFAEGNEKIWRGARKVRDISSSHASPARRDEIFDAH